MKLGIFGGTFDPIHHGHLIVAEHIREVIGLDRIVFIPSFISPHKQDIPVTAALDRLAMVREAVRSNPFFEVSDIEISRGGVSFTVDTLREFKKVSSLDDLFLIMGVDNLRGFPTWKDPEVVLQLAKLIAMNRPRFAPAVSQDGSPPGTLFCDVPAIDISATDIRRRVAKGLRVSYLVPPAVERYIEQHRLYRPHE